MKKIISAKFVIGIVLFLCLIVCVIINGYYSYNGLTVRKYSLESDKINTTVRFLIISDLHDHCFGEKNSKLLNKIIEQSPDAILIVGDMINNDSDKPEQLFDFLKKLVEQYDVYYALGNHELDYMNHIDSQLIPKIENIGIQVLEQKYQDIVIQNQTIRIGGMYDYAFPIGPELIMPDGVKPFLDEYQKTDYFKLMLSHRPDSFVLNDASKEWDIDLVISGHAHGGQIVLPFLGGLYAPDQGLFPEYVHGLYKKDKLNILITSGLGSHKEALPRWNNIPEIMVLEID